MRFGITLPNIGKTSNPHTLAELAHAAEEAGWDGVFVWDAVYIATDKLEDRLTHDPWIILAAIAMRTERVRIGTFVTPLSRRRPWKVARETVTLDHLSNGRLTLAVGLGALDDGAFSKVGEVVERKTRAKMLDESLDILAGLWSGQPFRFSGEQYQMQEMTFLPTPVQSPHIPVWVVGAWPRIPSIQRTLRWDGIVPAKMNDDGSFVDMTHTDMQAMKSYIDEHRALTTPFDIVLEGETPGNDHEQSRAIVQSWAASGVTWWLESVWKLQDQGVERMLERIKQGP